MSLVLVLVAPFAMAQPLSLDAQRFRPAPGPLLGATVSDPRPLSHLELSTGLSASYAYDLVPMGSWADGYALTDLASAEFSLALGLYKRVEIGMSLPLTGARETAAERAVTTRARYGVGDLRTAAKVGLLSGAVDLALLMDVFLPTASYDYPLGGPAWRLRPGLTGTLNAGAVRLGLQLAYEFRRARRLSSLRLGDALRLSPVVEVNVAGPLSVFVEGQLELAVASGSGPRSSASELSLGLVIDIAGAGELRLGAGTGRALLGGGYVAPAVRAFASFRSSFGLRPCALPEEDFDGYQDDDGCADPDNDGDGLLDVEDRCPNLPEDHDGFLDGDGCPDWDDDADGLVDRLDRCPRLTEDRDGFSDDDGCPEPDNDEDGVPDGYDACAMEPEDRDGYQDDDGCPEPGPLEAAVMVAEDRILVSESIYFEHDRDVIRAVSLPLLEQVAGAIADLPQLTQVRIIGHTDDAGSSEYNLDLSFRRARAVSEFLKSRGISPARLTFEGRGGTEPVTPNSSPEGRALNRRVEFQLLRPAAAP